MCKTFDRKRTSHRAKCGRYLRSLSLYMFISCVAIFVLSRADTRALRALNNPRQRMTKVFCIIITLYPELKQSRVDSMDLTI